MHTVCGEVGNKLDNAVCGTASSFAVYENEREVGDALDTIFKEGIVQRTDLFVTGKLW